MTLTFTDSRELAVYIQNVAVTYADTRFRGAKLNPANPDHAIYIAENVERAKRDDRT